MSISRAKRAANNKWDAENMQNIACKLKKDQVARFKEYAEKHGTTCNALLRGFILSCISSETLEKRDNEK